MSSTGTGERYEVSRIFETVLSVGSSRARYEIFEYRLYMDPDTEYYMLRIRRAPRARADIWILAYRDITAGVKIDLEASWIFVKDP